MQALIASLGPGALLTLHAAATWYMAGVIWMVQCVHYPLMARVGAAGWTEYERAHRRRMTLVVMPAMLLELAAATWLALRPGEFDPVLARTGLVLLAAIWLSTFFVQVPLHDRLQERFDPDLHRRLVRTNGLRTAAWSARALLAAALLPIE